LVTFATHKKYLFMNHTLLILHNLLRWAIVILAVIVIIKSLMGWLSKSKYGKADNMLSLFLMICADTQLLIGLMQYFITSEMMKGIRSSEGIMKNNESRFWAVEHITGMIAAIALIHVGRILAKKSAEDSAKFKKQFIWFTLAMLLILGSMPWARPLFPQF
jgi:hypothetical protein